MLYYGIKTKETHERHRNKRVLRDTISTLQDWKKSDPDNWRNKVYKLLKKQELKLKQ